MADSSVDRIHVQLRRMAADFALKPETRINEGELARSLGVSRTPLREALNRLVAEGFLTFRGGHGFFCRSLSPKLIMNWYEARCAIETEGARLAMRRATDTEIDALGQTYEETEAEYFESTDALRLLEIDETFHLRLLALSGNPQLRQLLDTIHGHIRYVRMVNLKNMRPTGGEDAGRPGLDDHRRILAHVARRDEAAAVDTLRRHIELRLEDATSAVAVAFAEIYMGRGEGPTV